METTTIILLVVICLLLSYIFKQNIYIEKTDTIFKRIKATVFKGCEDPLDRPNNTIAHYIESDYRNYNKTIKDKNKDLSKAHGEVLDEI